ncbi:hypothetical protein IKH79_04055 [Candidatus Saccharibacteria bacterium]|nr:hypothetical protein [Candidatus Saccharibacteria bacterium]
MEIFRTRRQYPAAPPLVLKRENTPSGQERVFLFVFNSTLWADLGQKTKKEKGPATASKTDPFSSGVWSYILESIFVFGLCAKILLKSYLYNKPPIMLMSIK